MGQMCCEKVISVENLMKAVKLQVREIRMLAEQCRRKRESTDQFEDINEDQQQGCSVCRFIKV